MYVTCISASRMQELMHADDDLNISHDPKTMIGAQSCLAHKPCVVECPFCLVAPSWVGKCSLPYCLAAHFARKEQKEANREGTVPKVLDKEIKTELSSETLEKITLHKGILLPGHPSQTISISQTNQPTNHPNLEPTQILFAKIRNPTPDLLRAPTS